jgi:hypothetical protein
VDTTQVDKGFICDGKLAAAAHRQRVKALQAGKGCVSELGAAVYVQCVDASQVGCI